jgi:hypothetical protein
MPKQCQKKRAFRKEWHCRHHGTSRDDCPLEQVSRRRNRMTWGTNVGENTSIGLCIPRDVACKFIGPPIKPSPHSKSLDPVVSKLPVDLSGKAIRVLPQKSQTSVLNTTEKSETPAMRRTGTAKRTSVALHHNAGLVTAFLGSCAVYAMKAPLSLTFIQISRRQVKNGLSSSANFHHNSALEDAFPVFHLLLNKHIRWCVLFSETFKRTLCGLSRPQIRMASKIVVRESWSGSAEYWY